jgi:hypothetical protein
LLPNHQADVGNHRPNSFINVFFLHSQRDLRCLDPAERKDDLRTRNAALAKRLVDLTGWSHGRVNAEMNRLAGISKVATATTDQLERRIRYAESWIRRIKRR